VSITATAGWIRTAFGIFAFLACSGAAGAQSREGKATEAGKAVADAEARALVERVALSLGDRERLAALTSLHERAVVHMDSSAGSMTLNMESSLLYPDRLRKTLFMPEGAEAVLVVSPHAGFTRLAAVKDMSPEQHRLELDQLRLGVHNVLRHLADPSASFLLAGEEIVGDAPTRIVELRVREARARWWVATATGRVLRIASPTVASGTGEPVEQVVDLSDWRDVEGIRFPYKATMRMGGRETGWLEVREIQVNVPVDPGLFTRPQPQVPRSSPGPDGKGER
jgi:hypothetical protein